MEYIEIKIYTSPFGAELVAGVLARFDIYLFETFDAAANKRFILENDEYWDYVDEALLEEPEGETVTTVRIPSECQKTADDAVSAIKALAHEDWGFDPGSLAVRSRIVTDDGWLDSWKAHFEPIKRGRVVIKAAWSDKALPGDVIFTIGTTNVFGTGQHLSTLMCVDALQSADPEGKRVADLGCGSGILTLISLMLGAKNAFACDIDRASESATHENAALNGIDPKKFEFHLLDALNKNMLIELSGETCYDIVCANIVADVIIGLADSAHKMLKTGGMFIASGIIAERLDDVAKTCEDAGFETVNSASQDGWACLTLKKT